MIKETNKKTPVGSTTKVLSPPRKETKSGSTKLHNALTLAHVREVLIDEGGIGYDC